MNIIIDEAHNILSSSSARESEAWKDFRLETFEEIIKEGRKFGVFLTIASQRLSDISEAIISQFHNYFLHRLVNNLDILAIERAVAIWIAYRSSRYRSSYWDVRTLGNLMSDTARGGHRSHPRQIRAEHSNDDAGRQVGHEQ